MRTENPYCCGSFLTSPPTVPSHSVRSFNKRMSELGEKEEWRGKCGEVKVSE